MFFGGSGGNAGASAGSAGRRAQSIRSNRPRRASYPQEPSAVKEASVSISVEEAFSGTSKVITVPTTEIGAHGLAEFQNKQYRVKIPAGATDGQVIRLARKGEDAGSGLVLKVSISPHPKFKTEGENVISTLSLSPWEAALGAKVPIQTLTGSVALTVPPGAQSGQRLRLKGKGLPTKSGHGDMFAEIKILVPKNLTEKEKKLLTELAEISKFNARE